MKKFFFDAVLDIIGINPFVFVPEKILQELFIQAGREKGYIPVCGRINKNEYTQTLVKYSGAWRLYINSKMLHLSPKRIGEKIKVEISFDPRDRTIEPHPKFVEALTNNPQAQKVYEGLLPWRQKELNRYIQLLRTNKGLDRNIARAIEYLLGKTSFFGKTIDIPQEEM
ncbi:MAG: YdeI/OmpD-associated family protein [Bacteroidetes bacterium]|nr:YdeI/OmpD-associated family protein [Bacteroidota bacterium]